MDGRRFLHAAVLRFDRLGCLDFVMVVVCVRGRVMLQGVMVLVVAAVQAIGGRMIAGDDARFAGHVLLAVAVVVVRRGLLAEAAVNLDGV